MIDPGLVRKTKIEIFRAVLAMDPQAPVFVELAETLIQDGQAEAALEVCRQGLRRHPDLLAGRVALVDALMAAGRTKEAQEALAAVKRQAVSASLSLGRLAELESQLLRAASIETASSESEPAAWRDEIDDQAAVGDLASPTLADLYLNQGQPEAAVHVYKRLLAKDPTNRGIKAKLRAMGALPPADQASARLLDVLVKWRSLARTRAAASDG